MAQVALDVFGKALEIITGGASAAGAGHDHGREGAQAHGLQNLLRDDDFLGPIATRFRRE